MNAYFHSLNDLPYTSVLSSLKTQAELENIPILKEESLSFLLGLVKWSGIKSALEIGTAIGYAALFLNNAGVAVTTIERDPERAERARASFAASGASIRLLVADALDVSLETLSPVDLVFIDAAKAQNQRLFAKFSPLLSPAGLIVTDNVDFHGYAGRDLRDGALSRDVVELARKIAAGNEALARDDEWDTVFLPLGDGLAVSRRRAR